MIKFSQSASLKLYIDMKTDLIKQVKHDFEKYCFKLMNDADAVFWENCGTENKDIKLITSEKKWFQNKIIILQSFSQSIYCQ